MHIPMQVDYGVRALVDLAANGGEGPVRATDISKRQGIPEPYLVQVLHSLRKRGLTTTQRGPLGGHSLALEPSEISMGMVMEYLGGTQTMVGCLDEQGHCTQSSACGQRSVWLEVELAMQAVLNSKSIADLLERDRLMEMPTENGAELAVRP